VKESFLNYKKGEPMLDNYNNNIDLMKKSLVGLWKRNELIANNISNADSSDYKAKDINFEEVLTREIEMSKKDEEYSINIEEAHKDSEFRIDDKEGLEVKGNGNNVDIDREMVNLAENQMRYNLVSEVLKQQLSLLNQVIDKTSG
jgi:flagellar basal-body rod protein FlgB